MVIGQTHAHVAEGGKSRERARLSAPVLQLRMRNLSRARVSLTLGADHVQLRGILERQASDKHGIDEREHRRVDANAECERDDRNPLNTIGP